MNSVSALLGRFNELTTPQHENQGKHLGHQHGPVGHHEGSFGQQSSRQGASQMSLYEVSLSFSSSTFSSHEKGVQILEQELEVKFTGARASHASNFMPTFQPPSAEDVANNVLGFVENRIKQEAADGASTERLDNLLSQAREGVEKGFGQAREQIEAMNLMTDKLDSEIDQSFEKINTGLDGLVETYVNPLSVDKGETKDSSDDSESETVNPQNESSKQNEPQNTNNGSGNVAESGASRPSGAINAGYSAYSSLSESAAIQITTQDGDVVSFNLEQIQASFERGELSANRFGFESSQLVGQYQSGQYSYSIDGELDEGEIQALNDLMIQIEGMSEQFFSGDFQGAFQSALELGFDGQEIAGFSVNLSQTSVQQVSAYQEVADLDGEQELVGSSGGRFDPLSDFFDSLQAAYDRANRFSQPAQLISELFDRVVSDRVDAAPETVVNSTPLEQMKSYMDTLLERLS